MKVLHISPNYFNSKLYDKLFMTLQSLGIVCEIFVCANKKIKYDVEKQYRVISLDKDFSIVDRFIYFGKQRKIYKNICQNFSLTEFNVVHAHTLFSAGYSAYLLHKKFELPYIVAIRETDVRFFKFMVFLRKLGITILNNSQNIIFLSPAYRDLIIDKYISKENKQFILEKSCVIPNGIDEYFLNNKHTLKRTIDIESMRLIYIGELIPRKNIETTIRACKLLYNKGYSVTFTIVGKIVDLKYERIVKRHSFIRYHSKCPKEEVLTHLRNSDIFVMPSSRETFGLVYAEAMSQGLPIIYSKGQGFDGQFENGIVGYSVNCFDHKDIAQKIVYLYDGYQQFSERCISLVDKFNWLSIADKYMEIYESSLLKSTI
jgi:glycosyltransferase involved in cell wall biosynthesis